MKTKLLRKLRKSSQLVYHSETSSFREYWELQIIENNCIVKQYSYFNFKEALNNYLMRSHNYMSRYVADYKKRVVLP
jgi:hypothetical protein